MVEGHNVRRGSARGACRTLGRVAFRCTAPELTRTSRNRAGAMISGRRERAIAASPPSGCCTAAVAISVRGQRALDATPRASRYSGVTYAPESPPSTRKVDALT
jgi:hypothetical protein